MNKMKALTRKFWGHVHGAELKLAVSVIRWKLEKEGRSVPDEAELNAAAHRVLEHARAVARKTGKNLYEILKEEAGEFFRTRPP